MDSDHRSCAGQGIRTPLQAMAEDPVGSLTPLATTIKGRTSYRIGVDVGGTFTDVLLLDDGTGELRLHKTPSVPADPAAGVISGLVELLAAAGVDAAEVARLTHGTTVATNAVLEGRGARVGLLTTAGFEQVLHLARSETPGPLAGWVTMIKPDPLAAVEDTRGVRERLSAQGEIVTALDEEHAERAIEDLIGSGVESLAVSLLNAYANPVHERRVAELVQAFDPEMSVSISSDVLPELREYERTNVAVMNAYIRPEIAGYLRRLRAELARQGLIGSLSVVRSDGGLMTVEAAIDKPVHTLFSGPAAGVAGAAQIAQQADCPNFLSFDMGGTSTDVALCLEGGPVLTRETKLGYFPVKAPAIDVRSVGAGGGSIAHVPEATRALRVGPQSAGAEPGPASYGKGGAEATVTDANVVLGNLPRELLGGSMVLDLDRARQAVGTVADALDLSLEQAAEGIIEVVNENMVGALRLVSVEKGHDPRDFGLVAFGGAGPLHANALADLMGCFPVIIPPTPGVLAALGGVVSPFRSEFSETLICRFDEVSPAEVAKRLRRLGTLGETWLADEGVSRADGEVRCSLGVQYHKQALEIAIDVDPAELAASGFGPIVEAFAELHEREYGFRLDVVCELVSLRAVALGPLDFAEPPRPPSVARPVEEARIGLQRIYHRGRWLDAALYDRAALAQGHRVNGPAVVTQTDSTTLVLPSYAADVDAQLNLLIRPTVAPSKRAESDSPIVVDIVENALKNIRREMDASIFRAAMSTVIREEHDAFPLIADEHGRMLAGQFGWPLDEFFELYPKSELRPGDVVMLNDPYLCGGAIQHTVDMLLLRPIFYQEELVGFASQFGNLTDLGGAVPGSMPTASRSIFEEGIRFPPVKLYESGRLVEPIVSILARNSRTPELTVADTLAMAAANACRRAAGHRAV